MILWWLLWRSILFTEFIMLLRNLMIFLIIWAERFDTLLLTSLSVLTFLSWVLLLWIWWGVFAIQQHIGYVIFFTLVGLIHGLSDKKLLLEYQLATRLLWQLVFLAWVSQRRLCLGTSFGSYTCGKSKQFICSVLEHFVLLLKSLEQVAHHLWLLSLRELLIIKLYLLLCEIFFVFSLRMFSRGSVGGRFLSVRLIIFYAVWILFASVRINLCLIVFGVLFTNVACAVKFILWFSSSVVTLALNGLLHSMIQIQAAHVDGLGTLRDWRGCFLNLLLLYGRMINLASLALKSILIIKTELRVSWFWALLRCLIARSRSLRAYFGSGLLHQSEIANLFL